MLAFDVFARIANDVRVGMLETLMKDHDLEDSWPFVLPVLRKVFGLRNRLAHGFVERVEHDRIQVTSYNRGKESSVEYSPQELGWLVWQSKLCAKSFMKCGCGYCLRTTTGSWCGTVRPGS